jgi:hypothetical protein
VFEVNRTFPTVGAGGNPTVPLPTTGSEFKDANRVTAGFEQAGVSVGVQGVF